MPLEHLPKKPNIVLIITDQEREVQHWPDGWAKANLPARSRLMEHGMHFTNAYCNSATCSPSRATLLTGLYPARHRVKTLIQSNDPENKAQNRLPVLPPHLPNLARVLEAEGYYVVYKGKFHLSRPVKYNAFEKRHNWSEADVAHMAETYGFHEWNPPDMGDPTAINNFGGGDINNDGRFVDGSGTAAGRKVRQDEAYEQSAVGFLNNYARDKPFCLVVSLVGPHDAQAYPGRGIIGLGRKPLYARAGYELAAFEHLPIDAPPTVAENITTKPSAHRSIRRLTNVALGKPRTPRQQRTHARFYAYLCKEVDRQILKVLDALDANGFTEDTLIVRTADHGELAMSHGGMVEKFYNVYQEAINVPLIVSNPKLFPEGQTTEALAALVDVVPTLAALVGAPDPTEFQGRDLTPVLTDPAASVQDCVHFTSDDDTWPTRGAPGCIRAIVEKGWKYAVYYDPYAGVEPEYEMYDLKNDPFEVINLAHEENWDPTYADERRRLHQRLSEMMDQHGTLPPEVQWPTADDFAPGLPYKRETKRLYARDVVIEAPIQAVWDTFTDLPHLGEWNPLLIAIEGELGLGQRLQVRIAAMPAPIEARVIRYNPPFELQWLDAIPGRAMTPCFSIRLETVGENRTRFVVEESFEGPLVGIAGKQLDRVMPPQYEAMCRALKARVERAHSAYRGSLP
jgi:arylsulfatase A-like enzyme